MKSFIATRFSGFFLIIFLAMASQLSAGNDIVLKAGITSRLDVTESTHYRLQVANTLSSFNTLSLNTAKGNFVELMAEGYSKSNVYGNPELPVLSKLIEVPAGAVPEITVVSYEVKEYKLSDFGISDKLFPAQPPQPKSSIINIDFAYNSAIYATNSFIGDELAKVEMQGFLRGVRLANLVISPVEYNPVTNTIRVYDNLIVDIRFNGGDISQTNFEKSRTASPYFRSLYNRLINYQNQDNLLDTLLKAPVKYVIVSDPMFQDALQPFIHWKIKKGFNVVEAYTNNPAVGNTFNSIKAYLQGLYTSGSPTDPSPSFVLFVGDVDQIPAYNCGAHVSDLYYCEYSGDFLPEVYYGRFSANNLAELQPQIDKTLQYEQYLMPDPSFLNEVVMVAGADASHQLTWGNGQINYGTTYYFNEAHNLVSHTYLQPEPGGGNYSQNIQTNVSNGVSYANYTAHGSPDGWADPSFSISDIANLQNADKYCLMVGNCCQTSTYNGVTFGEELLRAANKGALGYIGASDYSYWDEDYWWGVGTGQVVSNPTYETTGLGAYDRTFHDHGEPYSEWYATMDQMVFAGNLAVQESNSSMKQYYWETYCLMGDPSTMVYFSVPPALSVDYAPLLPMGSPTFEIQTEPNTYVAISKDNVLHGVAEADENGLAILNIQPFTQPGYANVVITKQNREPFIDSVLVASPEGPYLVLDNYQIKDNGGNNNEIPEFNEPLTVDLTFENFGNANAINATSTLTTNDPYVTVPGNTHIWPMIASNGSASAADAFTIQVNEYIPDLHNAQFTINTLADTSGFSSQFNFVIYAPKLTNGNFVVDDASGGNGNGQLDAGETIHISLPTTNTGHCTSSVLSAQLILFGNYVTSNSPVQTLGALAPGETATSSFSFSISPDAPLGSTFSLYVAITAGPYNAISSLFPTIGPQVEDYETGNFLKYSWRMKGSKQWKTDQATKYEGQYAAKSGAIGNNQQSEMYIDAQVLSNDTISFYRKVSSETGYDFLKFYVDGNELGSWSGNKDWAKVSFPIAAGSHRFIWAYEKDDATISGQDAAWVDYIVFPPFSENAAGPLALNMLATPPTVCPGNSSQLYVFATGGTGTYNYNWTPAATLNYPGIFNPIATPLETTTYNITVTSGMFSASQSVTVTVDEIPAAPVVSSLTDHLVSSVAAGNQWYNSQGLIAGATSQTYYPTHTDTYYAKVINANGCESAASNEVAFGFTGMKPVSESGFSVYPNPFSENLHVNYNLKIAGTVKIILFNAIGNELAVLEYGERASGNHKVTFDGSSLSTGIYYCKIFSDSNIQVAKIIKN